MIVLCILMTVLFLGIMWYTWKYKRVVTYLDGRVIDLENGKWGINSGGSSGEAIRIAVMFPDLSSVVIKARRNKVYSLGEHLIIKRVVLYDKYPFYKEVIK